MDPRFIFFGILLIVLVLIDLYTFQAIKVLSKNFTEKQRNRTYIVFWGFTIYTMLAVIMGILTSYMTWPAIIRNYVMAIVFIGYISKVFLALFMLADDVSRLVRWLFRKSSGLFSPYKEEYPDKNGISRSEFLTRSGFFIAMLPLTTLTYGMVKGAYDYRVIYKKLKIKSLPAGFDGMRIVQISDLHAGSFAFPRYINEVVRKVMEAKPDLILFTGDIINNLASELDPFIEIFKPMKAPMGVYSILGNHDYGEYMSWNSETEKEENFRQMIEKQKEMGWDVLRNENRILERSGDKLALVGVENWSSFGNFMKYGNLEKAMQGTDEAEAVFLLTHDPTHWQDKVLAHYPQIELTFAGHTHGMQFGADLPNLKWSPVQYFYKYWHGLYQEGEQYLYVNRGLGFTGFPGRVGMTPEITVFDLTA